MNAHRNLTELLNMVSRRRAPKTKPKPESSDKIHKPKQNIAHYVMYIISSGFIVLGLLLYVWYIYNPVPKTVSSKETHNMYRLPSSELLNSAHGLAYSGDIESLKRLVRNYDKLDWSNVQYKDQPSETLIHRALQGRQDSISKSSDILIGNHEVSTSCNYNILLHILCEFQSSVCYVCVMRCSIIIRIYFVLIFCLGCDFIPCLQSSLEC